MLEKVHNEKLHCSNYLTNQLHKAESYRSHKLFRHSRVSQHFVEPEVFYYCDHNSPSLISLLSQMNPVHIIPSYFLKSIIILSSYLIQGLPSCLFFLLAFPPKSCMYLSLFPFCLHASPIFLSRPLRFDHPIYI
jgi:hypothetical protein